MTAPDPDFAKDILTEMKKFELVRFAAVEAAGGPSVGEQAYADLADELNDPGTELTVEDFVPATVEAARLYAQEHGLSWPPKVGDFDRYRESRQSS